MTSWIMRVVRRFSRSYLVTTEELQAQVAQEVQAITAAPVVQSGPLLFRCSFCGQLTSDLQFVETVGEGAAQQSRYRGRCCGG